MNKKEMISVLNHVYNNILTEQLSSMLGKNLFEEKVPFLNMLVKDMQQNSLKPGKIFTQDELDGGNLTETVYFRKLYLYVLNNLGFLDEKYRTAVAGALASSFAYRVTIQNIDTMKVENNDE